MTAQASVAKKILGALSGLPAKRRLLIFTYHRVLERSDYLLDGEPTSAQFETHCELIARYLNPLPLSEAVDRLENGDLPPRAACVTFDDGYRNNYELAAPMLRKHGIPATFFITTGAIESGSMFNDRIIEAVRRARGRWDLSPFGLGIWDCETDPQRRKTLQGLLEPLKYRPHDEREALSHQILAAVTADRLDLMMTSEMVSLLAKQGFEIGAHTVNHPILQELDDDQAEKEIQHSRDWLTRVLGTPPSTFAYPNGKPGTDFAPRHRDMVEHLGFSCAVSTEWAVASRRSHRYALPRLTPWEFEESGWLSRVAKSYTRSWLPGS